MSTALFNKTTTDIDAAGNSYKPTVEDVLTVKEDFIAAFGLPLELIDAVIDFAEYWPHASVRRSGRTGDEYRIRGGVNENSFLLRSYPLGYVPKESDPTHVGWEDSHSYLTTFPKPWLDPGKKLDPLLPPCPNKNTEDIVNQWSRNIRRSEKASQSVQDRNICRKIVFTFRSHDQGWGGGAGNRGTYKDSYTWFDAGKERLYAFDEENLPSSTTAEDEDMYGSAYERLANGIPELNSLPHFNLTAPQEKIAESKKSEPVVCTTRTILPEVRCRKGGDNQDVCYIDFSLVPDLQCLQKNIVADKQFKEHEIVWSCQDNFSSSSVEGKALNEVGRGGMTLDGHFVRQLRVGDVVTIWGKARFPGWVNVVEEVGIDIYWAV